MDESGGAAAQDPPSGQERVGWQFVFTAAAYDLIRLPKLLAAPA